MSVPEDTTTKSAPIPSPALVAKKKATTPVAPQVDYSSEDLTAAEKFGRLGDNGTVYVTDNGAEREIGQFPQADGEDALKLFARRYLDLKAKVELFAARLESSSIKTREIDESVKNLAEETKEPAVVGDIAALRTRLDELKTVAELAQKHKKAVDEAVAKRTEIVEKAEQIVAGLGDSTNWRNTADEFKKLFETWQEHQRRDARIDKPQADALWKRFSAARSTFNQSRRKWAQARDAQRDSARSTKEGIIAEAESLRNSTDWAQTSHSFNQLMDQWKAAGRVGRSEDDALWGRFRAAADTFFNARQADRDQMGVEEKDNLVKKEALLVKAEALVPVSTEEEARQARTALGAIQDEWDQAGRVPREDLRRIEERLSNVEKQIKSVEEAAWTQKDPETDARKSSFEVQLNAQLAELDEKIAAESDPAKKKALETEKATKQQWLNAVK
jgi:tetrahydromethanopterin S-methyltransferase subunit G